MNLNPTVLTLMHAPPQDSTRIVGRLAPSPTGGLHLGHARTFLVAWLAARSAGGKVLLRVEDLDNSRSRTEAKDGAFVDLRWLGLDWDEGPDLGGPSAPYTQSERYETYQSVLGQLKQADMVYPCTCTRADILKAASAPHSEDEGLVYPGTCAGRSARDALALVDRPFAWRFRVPAAPVAWNDLFRGPMSIEAVRLGGDFVVARSPAGMSYQLAVVTDDALMGINQVIRGDDLVPSTPRQILLYRSLGWAPPQFGHIPLTVGPDGRRLAKRDGSIKLATLRNAGVDPNQLVGQLALSCGWTDKVVPSTPGDWIGRFRISDLPPAPWVVAPEWIDGSATMNQPTAPASGTKGERGA
ncbi:tRNA glutamyl-Q(34) synthetase GluQRS [Singulisphaera acidiphila]|uniref:Glutamyl-or glutaminyl-tRNA synthetase n=1 Tax=Singulisphaera acidiphila (strain ATCC BAA-1392 / DSM 18658 / VKM B-2454 / MOB10) TaxID=886293 RepID=L0D9L1_SINAD|nr:tRNA glutamyl-Q(34) synthetase GluQRS [Singulisphaera acidiphila]AGA25555.1 glutamyl- or glutaminyl-tRNA synthetase [Singulisphaera acidiphila DSM 18658]